MTDGASLRVDDIAQQIMTQVLGSINLTIGFTNTVLRPEASRRLLHHYLHRTHKVMALCQGAKNPFLHELIPMAMSNELILNALLAFSGIHHADITGTVVDESTWLHYGQAIQGEKYGLTLLARGNREVLVPLVVTAMLLCITETFKTDAGDLALQHLRAARVLLQDALQLPDAYLGPGLRVFLVERYAYTMCLAHITMGPSSDDWVLEDAGRLFSPEMENQWLKSGCVYELFQLIPQVSIFAQKQLFGQSEEHDQGVQLFHLQSTITSWQPNLHDETHALCGSMYKQALQVYLLSVTEEPIPGRAYTISIQGAFDLFIPFLGSIPADSPLSTTMCWPLAVFGSCARTTEHQAVIGERLDVLSVTFSAQSVRDTKRLLDELWELDDSLLANPLGFQRIMWQRRMTVLFL
jgi:hypothetical protein